MDIHMDTSFLHQSHGGGLRLVNLVNNWVQIISLLWHGLSQEQLQSGLHFHLIYIKSSRNFQCSGWSYACNLTSSQPWVWVEMAQHDSHLGTTFSTTTMAWLLPGATSDWITHPSYIYIKCLSTFQYSGWCCASKPYVWSEMAEYDSQLGTKLNNTTMTWMRTGTISDWITLPSYIYISCLSTIWLKIL